MPGKWSGKKVMETDQVRGARAAASVDRLQRPLSIFLNIYIYGKYKYIYIYTHEYIICM